MRLTKVRVQGYRSITNTVDLPVDRNVTVVLGANDHGKTNLLHALSHLNPDTPFEAERDLSWDMDDSEAFPAILYTLALTDADKDALVAAENQARQDEQEAEASRRLAEEGLDEVELPPIEPIRATDISSTVTFQRIGCDSELNVFGLENLSEAALRAAYALIPRVELIAPWHEIPDSITPDQFAEGGNEFMLGILYQAGIEEDEVEDLFDQDDRTQMRLKKANVHLNAALQEAWSQGSDLSFELVHDSAQSAICLRITDPAVQRQLVRASHRSSGFTHYFAMRMILHARETENPRASYIWLFDEPGLHLHPTGQHDLLQVIERLGSSNQVCYVTHSLFMINRTFPARHRLIRKEESGTALLYKPYVGQWRIALDELGYSLAGTILFASHILFTEGDTEPILIPALLQRLIAHQKIDIDLNVLTVRSTGSPADGAVVMRLFAESPTLRPKMAYLADGDKGGKDNLKRLKPTLEQFDIPAKTLTRGTAIEDHLPHAETLYVRAFAAHMKIVLDLAEDVETDLNSLESTLLQSHANWANQETPGSIVAWANKAATEVGKLDGPMSKIGVAREYVRLLEEADAAGEVKDWTRATRLANTIQKSLALPKALHLSESIVQR